MTKNRKLIIVAVVLLLIIGGFIGVVARSNHNKNSQGVFTTGGDYSPTPTTVVFRNSDNLFASFTSEETDSLQSQIATKLNDIYGKGKYVAYVKGDTINFLAPGIYDVPSYWFEVDFDHEDLRLKVTTNFDGNVTNFSLTELR